MAVRNTKDIIEKSLLNDPEVFCDIFNHLVLRGHGTMKPEELKNLNVWSAYTDGAGEIREQYRDVLMEWKNSRTRIMFAGVENMTNPDESLFLKIPEYDSSVLRNQLKNGKIKGKLTPAITIVLWVQEMEGTGRFPILEKSTVSSGRTMEALHRLQVYRH